MVNENSIKQAALKLKSVHERTLSGKLKLQAYLDIVNAREAVLGDFQSVFSDENIQKLTEDEFRSFLKFSHNKHWKSLHRLGGKICVDMPRLQKALAILFDESRPIVDRLNNLVTVGKSNYVPGLGKAVLTPLLLVRFPEQYGVWNRVAQDSMMRLGIWPSLDRKQPFGERYKIVNDIILQVSQNVGVDLWTLDGLWWAEGQEGDSTLQPISDEDEESDDTSSGARFSLERHLHDFLRDNWKHTELGKDWALYEEDGDTDAGYEYITSVGKIDLLAKHLSEPRWLVVELKRDRSSDRTVGQLLRYMGWVNEELAEESESVHGLIIAHRADERLRYALKQVQNVEVNLYEVDFRLKLHE